VTARIFAMPTGQVIRDEGGSSTVAPGVGHAFDSSVGRRATIIPGLRATA
jgi:hypothetical protein